MTTSATTPMIASLDNPRSIMEGKPQQAHAGRANGSGFGFFLGLDVDGRFVGHLLDRGGWLVFLALDAILETLDGLADVGAHIADFLGAENQHHDDQHDQPVPNAH
jgi:hypothetical protein